MYLQDIDFDFAAAGGVATAADVLVKQARNRVRVNRLKEGQAKVRKKNNIFGTKYSGTILNSAGARYCIVPVKSLDTYRHYTGPCTVLLFTYVKPANNSCNCRGDYCCCIPVNALFPSLLQYFTIFSWNFIESLFPPPPGRCLQKALR